jgi:hypothetical protein
MHALHALALTFLSPTFLHDMMAQTSIRVIASASSVSILVQLVKVFFPEWICGRRVIAVNLLVSIAAVFIGMDPQHFWTQSTLAEILSVAGLATGVHSNTKTLLGQPIGVPDPKTGGSLEA